MSEQHTTAIPSAGWWKRLGQAPAWMWALAALVILMLITWQQNPAFVRPINLINILNQNAVVGIVAVGMTLVIILAGIDLSVGSLLALAGGLGIMALNGLSGSEPVGQAMAVLGAVGVMAAVGMAAGALTGSLIAWGKVAPFIVTLGALVAFRSGATVAASGVMSSSAPSGSADRAGDSTGPMLREA